MVHKYLKNLVKGLRSIITIETIMFIRLLFGFYYNISSNRIIKLFARLYCILTITFAVQWYIKALIANEIYFSACTCIVHVATAITNLIYQGEFLFNFVNKMKKIHISSDAILQDPIPISGTIFIVTTLQKVLLIVIYFLINGYILSRIIEVLSSLFISVANSLHNLTRVMLFELLYIRMRLLRKRLVKDLSIARRFEEGETVLMHNINNCMNIYKNLLNAMQDTNIPMKILIFTDVVCVVPKYLISSYAFIGSSNLRYSTATLIASITETITPFIPAVLVELIRCEVDKMRLCVLKQLLVCKGAETREVILDAVTYFEQHPFKYTIWRVLTVDLTLILTIIGCITTYTLAMIQFAHFYN